MVFGSSRPAPRHAEANFPLHVCCMGLKLRAAPIAFHCDELTPTHNVALLLTVVGSTPGKWRNHSYAEQAPICTKEFRIMSLEPKQ
jgi:hypothetical protein